MEIFHYLCFFFSSHFNDVSFGKFIWIVFNRLIDIPGGNPIQPCFITSYKNLLISDSKNAFFNVIEFYFPVHLKCHCLFMTKDHRNRSKTDVDFGMNNPFSFHTSYTKKTTQTNNCQAFGEIKTNNKGLPESSVSFTIK